MGRNWSDIHDRILHATWLATTACCTALHDIGFDTEEIAEVMPEAMKRLGDAVIGRWYGIGNGIKYPLFPGDAIKAGQDYAEQLAAQQAGGVA